MLVCQRGNDLLDVFTWLEDDLNDQEKVTPISSWIFSVLKSKEEANKHNHSKLETRLGILVEKAQNKLNQLNEASRCPLDLQFIDNLDELALFLNGTEVEEEEVKTAVSNDYQCLFPSSETNIRLPSDLGLGMNLFNKPETSLPVTISSSHNQYVSSKIEPIDDQEEKIKTLADNIIAAIPYRIKIHKSNCENSIQSLDRNSAGQDDNFSAGTSFSFNQPTIRHVSPQHFYSTNHFNDIRNKETSPELNETTDSSFHIDSPPSTGK